MSLEQVAVDSKAGRYFDECIKKSKRACVGNRTGK